MIKTLFLRLRYHFPGDDDRPEIIELSEFNQGDNPFAFCAPKRSTEQEYRSQQYQEYTSSDHPPEEYPIGEYQQPYSNEYGHEHDYHQLQFPESNLSEGEGGNNEDSVSEVNLSDGNIPKMKLEEVRFMVILILLFTDFHHMCTSKYCYK